MNRKSKRFLRNWAMYPVRRVMYRHINKILCVAIAAIIALIVVLGNTILPKAADVTTTAAFEADTSGFNKIAEVISSNAQVIHSFVDSIDVSEVSSLASDVNVLINSSMSGAPVIIVVVLIFFVVFFVMRKVIGR